MVSTRRGNRNTHDNGPGEGQGDGAESRNRTLVGQTDHNVRGNIVFDDATMEALRNMMLQTIQSVLPTVQATVPEVEGSIQGEPMETEDTPAIPPPQNASFPQALKTFLSMKPDSYDGSGEPVQMAYWFSHIE